jgi:hypothetical protein
MMLNTLFRMFYDMALLYLVAMVSKGLSTIDEPDSHKYQNLFKVM